MSRRRVLVFSLWLVTCSLQKINSQSFSADSLALKNTILLYQQTVRHDMQVYSGTEYVWTYPKSIGHPYFLTDTAKSGCVVYDGITYYDLPLLFEIVQQEVLLEGTERLKIKLNKEKVDAFTINGHFFKKLFGDAKLNNGFYECLYDKDIKVFAKHEKEPRRQFNPEDPYMFKETALYYVQKSGSFYPINEQNDLLNILADKRKNIKDYWKANRLSFKKSPEETIINTIEFYTREN